MPSSLNSAYKNTPCDLLLRRAAECSLHLGDLTAFNCFSSWKILRICIYMYLLTVLSLFKINNSSVAVQMNAMLNSRGCHSHEIGLSFLVCLKRDMEKPHQERHYVMPFIGLTMIVLQSIKLAVGFIIFTVNAISHLLSTCWLDATY